MNYLRYPYLPLPVTNADLAFPASVKHLMPVMTAIPVEFTSPWNPWVRVFNDLFFGKVKNVHAIAQDGIDSQTALRHLRCIAGSYEPKHEHKEAAFAFLASLWFTSIIYDKDK